MPIYNQPALRGVNKQIQSFGFIYDSGMVYEGSTGGYRPVQLADVKEPKISDDFGWENNIGPNSGDYFEYANNNGYGSVGFHMSPPLSGNVQFEGSFDGTHYSPITFREINGDGYVQSSRESSNFIGSISSLRSFRFRNSSNGLSSGTVMGRASSMINTLEGIEHNAPPHKIGYTILHRDFSLSGTISNQTILTPSNGHKFAVTDLNFSAAGANNVTVVFFDGQNISGNRVAQLAIQPPTDGTAFYPIRFSIPYLSTGVNSSLKVSTTNNITLVGVVHGYEIPE